MKNNDEIQKTEALETVISAIEETSNIFQKYPFYFVNEESIRCHLYSKILEKYSEPICYKKDLTGKVFLSSSVHANANIRGVSHYKFPDILLYYPKKTEEAPILATHKDKRRKVWFFSNTINSDETIEKRIIIEIKLNKDFDISDSKKEGKFQSVLNDIEKVKKWCSYKSFVLYFDRSNKLDNQHIQRIKNSIDRENIYFYYCGYTGTDKKNCYYIPEK